MLAKAHGRFHEGYLFFNRMAVHHAPSSPLGLPCFVAPSLIRREPAPVREISFSFSVFGSLGLDSKAYNIKLMVNPYNPVNEPLSEIGKP